MQTLSGYSPEQPAPGDPTLSRELELDDLQRSILSQLGDSDTNISYMDPQVIVFTNLNWLSRERLLRTCMISSCCKNSLF